MARRIARLSREAQSLSESNSASDKGHVPERGTHELVDFLVQRSRTSHRFYYNLRLRLCLLLVSLRSILLGNDVLVLGKKSKKHHLILPFKSIFFKNCSVSFSDPSCNYFFVISFACFASKVVVAMIFQITFNSSSFFVLFHLRFKSITGTRTRKLKLTVFFRLNGLI